MQIENQTEAVLILHFLKSSHFPRFTKITIPHLFSYAMPKPSKYKGIFSFSLALHLNLCPFCIYYNKPGAFMPFMPKMTKLNLFAYSFNNYAHRPKKLAWNAHPKQIYTLEPIPLEKTDICTSHGNKSCPGRKYISILLPTNKQMGCCPGRSKTFFPRETPCLIFHGEKRFEFLEQVYLLFLPRDPLVSRIVGSFNG